MEEMTTLRKFLKEVLSQLTDDIGDHISKVSEESKKTRIETNKALSVLTREVVKLKEEIQAKDKAVPKESSVRPTSSFLPSSPSSIPSQEKTSSKQSPRLVTKQPTNQEYIVRKERKPKTRYQQKEKVLFVGDSVAHSLNFRQIEAVYTQLREIALLLMKMKNFKTKISQMSPKMN